MSNPFKLQRFVEARARVMDTVLAALARGRKGSHWTWFVFSRTWAVGRSPTAVRFGLGSFGEASVDLACSALGPRLVGCTRTCIAADWLARRGLAFNEAHEITGAPRRLCEDRGIGLQDVTDDALAAIDPRLGPELRRVLTGKAAVAARSCYGGTAPARVRNQIGRLREVVGGQRGWAAIYEGPRVRSQP